MHREDAQNSWKCCLSCTIARNEVGVLGGGLSGRGVGKVAQKESAVWRLKVTLNSNETPTSLNSGSLPEKQSPDQLQVTGTEKQ